MKESENLEKGKQELTPVFVSYKSTLEFHPEHAHIKAAIIELSSLWNSYIELFRELENTSDSELTYSIIEDHFVKISCKLQEMGMVLYILLDTLESLEFQKKFQEFESFQEKLCNTACLILYINKKVLTKDLLESLGEVEFSLYRCLTLGQKIRKKKTSLESSWIQPKKYEILKYLYRYCKYNLREYLKIYKIATQTIEEQKSVVFEIERAHQMYLDFLKDTTNDFLPGNLIDTYTKNYHELFLEDKIQHHEISISQRRSAIERIIREHKSIINEVDMINWSVGREAKNIINMEKTVEGRGDFSMKKLFLLFESAANRLKEYELILSRYAKLVSASKRLDTSPCRLVQIKSLDFNYLIVEGHLKTLKADVDILYSASKEIYCRRNELLSRSSKH